MLKDLEPPLKRAIEFLESQGFRYAIIGGIAMAQWGAVRVTNDVDIKVCVPDTDYPKVRAAIRAAFPKRARAHVPDNPLIVAVEIDGVIVDFLLALPGYEESIVTRAVRRDLGEFTILVCSAEDLIIQKAVAGRGKDWLDLEQLLVERWGRLDEDYIDKWLSDFADALAKAELVEQYREVHRRVAKIPRS